MKLSIITICYNSGKTVERTIKSVLEQNYKDYEYIIVDGGSSDNTLDIVKRYEPLFEGRLKCKSEPDKGIYNAMNKGVLRATGDLLGIVNSDDWLEPAALQSIVKIAENKDNIENSLFCGSLQFHYKDGSSQIFESNEERFYAGMKKNSFNHGAYHPAIFVGKNVYKTVGLFDENFKIAADIDFISRCYNEGCKFYFTKDIISNMFDGGVSNNLNLKKVIKDKKHNYEKYGYSKLSMYYGIFTFCSKLIIKSFLPESWIKKYRLKKN